MKQKSKAVEHQRPGRKPAVRDSIINLIKQQPLLSFTDLAAIVETSKQYVQLVADTTPGLREERQRLKEETIAKLRKRAIGYIPVE